MMNKITINFLFIAINLFCNLVFGQDRTYTNATALEFYEQINNLPDAIIIDVRPAEEQIVFTIENAILLSRKSALLSFIDTIDVDTPMLVYCNKGERSIAACKLLINKGFLKTVNLKHGFIDYRKKDYPVKVVKFD